jgi:Na+/H+ antiporter NhaC
MNWTFRLAVLLCILSAITTIVSFLLYVRARMAERKDEYSGDGHLQHNGALDRKERSYQSIHFISLLIFVALGVFILVRLSDKLNGVPQ